MASPAIIEPIAQKNAGDCSIACLAMLLGLPYVEVSSMALSLYPTAGTEGLWTTEIKRVALKLGHKLQTKKPVEIETSTGILVLRDHVVILFQGVIVDPADGLIYDYDTYLVTKADKPTRLLVA
jgi:ABC-type bacteriocin/lantibiotic exporter with double-glycine peptidase domain